MSERHVIVVGGGISGLASAWALTRPQLARTPEARQVTTRVTLLESDEQLGGKIQTTEFAGTYVDTGADAFLARVPWATHLCQELGIESQLVSPSRTTAYVWSRNKLRRFPQNSVLGVPSRLFDVARARIVSPFGLLRVALDLFMPPQLGRASDDQTVGRLVRTRLGREYTERVVDPLIGGINAGSVNDLSLNSCAPQLADVATRRPSLVRSVRDLLKRRPKEDANRPAFHAHSAGMSGLIDALTTQLTDGGVELRISARVTDVTPLENGKWIIRTADGADIEGDAVILATPAHVTDDLLLDILPEATEILRKIKYTSVAMVRLAYRTSAVRSPLNGSGFVVPAVDEHLMTACSWASSKWSHLSRPGLHIMRASVGRSNDGRFETMSDDEIIAAVHEELSLALDITEQPHEADVTRWHDAFPQFAPGHETHMLRLDREIARFPGLAIAGAAYHGLGIPSCVRTAREAAESLLAQMATQHSEITQHSR